MLIVPVLGIILGMSPWGAIGSFVFVDFSIIMYIVVRPTYFALIAVEFFEKGNYSESINYFEKAVKILRNVGLKKGRWIKDLYFNLAEVHYILGNLDESIKYIELIDQNLKTKAIDLIHQGDLSVFELLKREYVQKGVPFTRDVNAILSKTVKEKEAVKFIEKIKNRFKVSVFSFIYSPILLMLLLWGYSFRNSDISLLSPYILILFLYAFFGFIFDFINLSKINIIIEKISTDLSLFLLIFAHGFMVASIGFVLLDSTMSLFPPKVETELKFIIYLYSLLLPSGLFASYWIYQELIKDSDKLIGDLHYFNKSFTTACERYENVNKNINKGFINRWYYSKLSKIPGEFLSDLYLLLGDCKLKLGELEDSLKYLEKSLSISEKISPNLWYIYYTIAVLKEKQNLLQYAYVCYKNAIFEIERGREVVKLSEYRQLFFESKVNAYAKMIVLCLKLGKDKEAFQYAEMAKSRILLELLGNEKIKSKIDPELKKKEEVLLLKLKEIEYKIRKDIEKGRGLNIALTPERQEVEKSYEQLLLTINESNPEYYSLRKVNPLNLEEIQSLIGTNQLVEFFVTDEETIVFLVSQDEFIVIRIDINAERLKKKIWHFRKSITKKHNYVYKLSNDLYSILIKPIENQLRENLIIVPHDILHYLPFNALYDGQYWLIEKYKMRFFQSGSVIKFLKEKKKGSIERVLVVGNPTKDLQFSEIEAQNVAKKFNVRPLLREEARKDIVVSNLIDKELLHFACHGVFDPIKPILSGIKLADDDLRMIEIFNMDLNADLVVLSACETGLGKLSKGDEVEGLTRAFMYAGTPSVIASLWNVADKSTAEMFLNFYNLDGNKIERLRKAQIEIMKRHKHPYYWAGFVLFGEE